MNNIYIKGFSGIVDINGNWIRILDIYINLILLIHSPISKTDRSDVVYIRNELVREDLYLLITHLESKQLTYIMKKYNIIKLELSNDAKMHLITTLENYTNAFDVNSILRFKFASDIKNILILIPLVDFNDAEYQIILDLFAKLFQNLFSLKHEDKSDRYNYLFTVFREIPTEVISCLIDILRNDQKRNRIVDSDIRSIIETTFNCYINNVSNLETSKTNIVFFQECGILMNFSVLYGYYFHGKLNDKLINSFFELIMKNTIGLLGTFIIELYPLLSDAIRDKWNSWVYSSLDSMEPVYIRYGIINEVFQYDNRIENLLLKHCQTQIVKTLKYPNEGIAALHSVLRLVEKGYIKDISPYHQFVGYDDLFDFVCFPEEFDYLKFQTHWASWLSLERYCDAALKNGFDVLKKKYEIVMKDGPLEIEKNAYYKIFYEAE